MSEAARGIPLFVYLQAIIQHGYLYKALHVQQQCSCSICIICRFAPATALGRVVGWACDQAFELASGMVFGPAFGWASDWASDWSAELEPAVAWTLGLAALAVGVHRQEPPAACGHDISIGQKDING